MIKISLGMKPLNTVIELYETEKELPVHRDNEINKLALIDANVGSTLEDFNKHFSKLHAYLKNKKVDEAIQETKNLHNNVFFMIEKIGVWSYSFCPFIKSINGKPYEGSTMSDYHDTMNMLSRKGLTNEHCPEIVEELKKKLTRGLNSIFLIDTVMDQARTYTLS